MNGEGFPVKRTECTLRESAGGKEKRTEENRSTIVERLRKEIFQCGAGCRAANVIKVLFALLRGAFFFSRPSAVSIKRIPSEYAEKPYPFTAPAVIPFTMYFCNSTYRITTGVAVMTRDAVRAP